MDITRRCDYAFRMLRALRQAQDAPLSVAEVAEREGIPYSFARSIQHDLTKAGFITTMRGAHGGIALGCDLHNLTVLQVVEAMQGSVALSACVGNAESCSHCPTCSYHQLWAGASALLSGYFASIPLDDLLEQGAALPAVQAALGCSSGENARESNNADENGCLL